MKTLEIEYALVDNFFLNNKLVAVGITKSSGIVSHECDVLTVNNNGFITEYEIKVSISDVKADLKKKHRHSCNKIARTFFVLPEDLVDKAKELIPIQFGIISIKKVDLLIDNSSRKTLVFEKGYRLNYIRQPKRNKSCVPITTDELLTLYRLDNMRKRRYMKNLLEKEGVIYKYIKEKW